MASAKLTDMMLDPVSLEIMTDPCITECHHTFERSSIMYIFNGSQTTKCPLCKVTISVNKLGTNYALKSIIDSLDLTESKSKKCFVCGDINHSANQCTKKTCRKCNKTGHIANQCTESKNDNVIKCYNCGKTGHYKDKCTENKVVVDNTSTLKCYNCNKLGHHKNQCPENKVSVNNDSDSNSDTMSTNTNSTKNSSKKCYNCGKLGHHKNQCPEHKTVTNIVSTIKCYNCGNSGHYKDKCPEPLKVSNKSNILNKTKKILENICNKCGKFHDQAKCEIVDNIPEYKPNNVISQVVTFDDIYNIMKNVSDSDREIICHKKYDESYFQLNDDDF